MLRSRRVIIAIGAVLIAIYLVLVARIFGFSVGLETGFSGRTLWEWLELGGVVAVPFILGVLGIWFNRQQRAREEAAANQQAQDAALQAYLDQMSNLIVDRGLFDNPDDYSSLRKIAQARTTAILLGLDGSRKRRPLKLLYELGLLINEDEPIIELTNAGLDNADLSEITLHNVCLSRADLRGVDLGGADLEGADLSWVDLRGADLSKADLTNARLEGANLLPYDAKDPAGLSGHNLMKGADLNIPRLIARLAPRLTHTNLRGAKGLTQVQIEQAIGCQTTQLPDGLQRPEAWSESFEVQYRRLTAD
jgi:uncharacterized protein YjbI with pentapeptide repeats